MFQLWYKTYNLFHFSLLVGSKAKNNISGEYSEINVRFGFKKKSLIECLSDYIKAEYEILTWKEKNKFQKL